MEVRSSATVSLQGVEAEKPSPLCLALVFLLIYSMMSFAVGGLEFAKFAVSPTLETSTLWLYLSRLDHTPLYDAWKLNRLYLEPQMSKKISRSMS